jgi:hypothetical protein
LLPYKIHGEEPYNWRSYFVQRYEPLVQEALNQLDAEQLASFDQVFTWLLQNGMSSWFRYTDDPISLSRYPGFRELMALKSGDCIGLSYLNVMLFRSLGVPATLDFVPAFGRINAGHSSEMFWCGYGQRFRTIHGRQLRSPAKTFRYTFRQQGYWSNDIQPVVGQHPFVLDFLQHDHWIDVTHEHTTTATVEFEWDFTTDFAYITVFNFRQWTPVFWGKVTNGTARFENMGTDILYRIAVPSGNSKEFVGSIFRLDREGNKLFFTPDYTNPTTTMNVRARQGDRFIGEGISYSLYYYAGNGIWNLFETRQSERNHIMTFENVPANTLYIIQDNDRGGRTERIFTYNGWQTWW